MSKSSTSQSARAQRKREQILEGAQQLFLTLGYAGTSTDAIAKATGVSKETLYAYFPHKETLLAAVLQQVIDNVIEDPVTDISETVLTSQESLRTNLIELAQRLIHYSMQPDYLGLLRIIISESTRIPQLGTLFRTTVPLQGLSFLSHLLTQAQEQHLIEATDPDISARMFIGSLLTYILIDGLMLPDELPRQPDIIQITHITDLFLRALLPASERNEHK